VRLAFVVQRYGVEVSGGSELHCRWLAEHVARNHSVEVFTTQARDYLEWGDPYPAGSVLVNGVRVHRFPVRKRRLRALAELSERVFAEPHTRGEEVAWFRANGPDAPALVEAIAGARDRFDFFVFYSFRYQHVFAGLPRVREKAILVPTAEDDPALSLQSARELLRMPRGIVYLTPEEKALVEDRSGNTQLPSAIIGSGLDVPEEEPGLDVRSRFSLTRPFILYVGRIDRNKGCATLFSYFKRFLDEAQADLDLVLIGTKALEIPEHPRIRHLGLLTDAEKIAALRASALLVMPSFLESLSLILLEAWREGVPALVNARCRVLEGQCRRSNGGLYYRGYGEFAGALLFLLDHPDLARTLGRQGQEYVRAECAWETVLGRFLSLLEELLPG
jgi:glycosyltransferase involved in cell wall biosynthesis